MSYASLVVPRRTRCPPVLRANTVSANRVWFDPERALTADAFRKQCPLHYHLSRYDPAAVWATLKAGADPAKRDAAGRTVLDLAVEMAFELVETCLCTSTAVDNVDVQPATLLSTASGSQKASEVVLANPFVSKYKDICSNMYDHSERMRVEAKGKAHNANMQQQMPFLCRSPHDARDVSRKRFVPVFRAQKYKEPESYADEGRAGGTFPLPEEDVAALSSLARRDRPQQFLYGYTESGRRSTPQQLERDQARFEQRQLQHSFLVVVDDFFERPPGKAAIAQMRELVRRLNLLLTVVDKFSASIPLRREAAEKAGDLMARYTTHPYLYIATMYQLFRRYPKALSGEVWDVLNPADSRRLVLTVQSLRLRGHELLSYLGTICRLYDTLLSKLQVVDTDRGGNGRGGFPSGECGQYYLHMAFTLDDVGLFQKLVSSSGVFGRRDIFKWEDLLYTLMEYRDQFRDYLAPLLVKRLRARVQRRFLDDADKKSEYMEESVKYPYEERYLTRRLLEEYGDIFGPQEAQELSTMLRHWRYGAARPVAPREAEWHGRSPSLFKSAP